MNVLMIYPEFPDTFWSFKHALGFLGKKAAFPPLGLLTIAGLLPAEWKKKLVDMNVCKLKDKDIEWADYVMISSMVVQKKSAQEVIDRCRRTGVRIIAGGPLFSTEPDSIAGIDHLVLNEAELTLPLFLEDLKNGCAKRLYTTDKFAEMKDTPIPDWGLIDMKPYAAMVIQYTRGCPFNCDFCNITSMFGHQVRTKSPEKIINELDNLYARGWRNRVFFVDDNFIGNKHLLKTTLLPKLIAWRKDKEGITFQTEASINLADDQQLMDMMSEAGFDTVFIGIETPDDSSLAKCNKKQNSNRNLVEDVRNIQRAGMQVQGGFIVGFDSDSPSVFRRQIEFIQKSGIVTAMVGLLQAPTGTKLYQRMKAAGRLLGSSTRDNVEGTTNIVPKMKFSRLHQGYKEILKNIYSPKAYYNRVITLLREQRVPKVRTLTTRADIIALFQSIFRLGVIGKERLHYWKLMLWTLLRYPQKIHLAVTLAIFGYHFRKVRKR